VNIFQVTNWASDMGKEYTDRNCMPIEDWEQMYVDKFGLTRTEMNLCFIGDLNRDIKVLEVGCNIGNQLLLLQKIGFANLYGIELQSYAVEVAKQRTEGINIIQGNAFDIPFKDGFFDLVYTSGVLIHFMEVDLPLVMNEIYRCSRKYIWGFEYYNEEFKEIIWRGVANMMWKADYARMYIERFGLKLIKKKRWDYLNEPNTDSMFLLEK